MRIAKATEIAAAAKSNAIDIGLAESPEAFTCGIGAAGFTAATFGGIGLAAAGFGAMDTAGLTATAGLGAKEIAGFAAAALGASGNTALGASGNTGLPAVGNNIASHQMATDVCLVPMVLQRTFGCLNKRFC